MRVHTIFPSIQGEGSLSGVPMVMVRFQGCSAQCPWCDTKYAWDPDAHSTVTPEGILAGVNQCAIGHQWVLLTGGEPLEQDPAELYALIALLQRVGYKVALETNGSHLIPINTYDWVCVSPKPHLQLHPSALHQADELKFIVAAEADIPDPLLFEDSGAEVSLQPLSLSKEATDLCIKTVQERGWRLSLQLHKLIGIP